MLTGSPDPEVALLASERRFRALLESTPSVLIGLDADGRVVEWNPEAERVSGIGRDDALGRDYCATFVPQDACGEAMRLVARALDGETVQGVEWPLRARDGETRLFLWNVVRMSDPTFGPHSVLASGQDITERERLAGERRALDARVQRTQKLESLGVLAGGIAHDFNNLLVSILGSASMALEDLSADSPARELVAEIERAALRAAELTRQMLAFSGKGRFVVEPVDLSVLIVGIVPLLKSLATARAELRIEAPAGLPPVNADVAQLRQVIVHLVSNASDALGARSEDGGVIEIRTGVRAVTRADLQAAYVDDQLPEGEYVYLEVSDNGVGMPAETLRRLFDPFFTTKFTGRGLGLAATLGTVRGHRGAMLVRSTAGEGSTFTVYLPPLMLRTQAETPPAPRREGAAVGRGTVLVVDDETGVRLVARTFLVRRGYDVLLAADGRAALDVFRRERHRVSAVLLDLTMPNLSGETTLRAMLAIDPNVRVIVMSGYSRDEVAEQLARLPFAGFIQKPFRADELDALLHAALGA